MRCLAGAGLLMLVACNQVFGIGKTEPYDAAPDVIADVAFVKLTWQVADVERNGDPARDALDAPIVPAPEVRYAALGQPWVDTTYSPIDGAVVVDRAFFQPTQDGMSTVDARLPTWRLEYTLADGVPHEVQWSPEDKQGQLTVPLFGRATRKLVPIGGGYTVTPTGAPANYSNPRVFTTGQWSEGLIPSYLGGTAIDYDFVNAAAMSGSRSSPEPELGDRAFLVDYNSNAEGCRFAVGSAALDSAALEANKHSPTTAAWDASRKPITSETVSFETISRFLTALGPLHTGMVSGTTAFGIAASTRMPPLTGVAPSAVLPVVTELPAPVMMTLLQCPFDVTPLPSAAQPVALDAFSRLLHVQLVSSRRVLGAVLASGMETAIASGMSTEFKLSFPAAIPTMISLATPTNPKIALDGAAPEQIDIGPARGTLVLDFVPEMGQASPDYYDVTLHQLEAGKLVTRRIYTVTAPHVELEGATLAPGANYVLEIRSFKGHPGAVSGDFRPVSFPYGSAIVFTRTFRAS
ncbi:MAG: hypothetical protein H7138_05965 [Myxococcales bacterium]|nr:hypothetical protein [Myxococcales bacterium]